MVAPALTTWAAPAAMPTGPAAAAAPPAAPPAAAPPADPAAPAFAPVDAATGAGDPVDVGPPALLMGFTGSLEPPPSEPDLRGIHWRACPAVCAAWLAPCRRAPSPAACA
ncbi:hypothetical protein F1C12_21680 (plasmid) [Leifsonia shinshuensis]|uniref:Uncharacterized protein n=1 Tax=Leifsonia shinshuensis TaxID=150026 RepID=A0A7G6YHD3_9MICO|nr:hypothetical protein F1C12_21680 [Leifsonia shinshuensis]